MSILRITFGLIAFLVPGFIATYALWVRGAVTVIERVVLAVTLMVALFPLSGYLLSRAGVPITTASTIWLLIGWTLVATAGAGWRYLQHNQRHA